MVRAYEMESRQAIYPRIIVDDQVIDVARSSHSDIHSPDDEEEYVRSFLARDLDGKYYLDYVSFESVVVSAGASSHLYGRYLTRMSAIIERGLQHPDERVREKYIWLHPQYLDALKLAASTAPDSKFRLQNPGVCEQIEVLPRLSDLAEAARAARGASPLAPTVDP